MSRRVVITGLGTVCPLGNDVASLWSGLCQGKSGIGPITQFDASAYTTTIAGEVRDLDFGLYCDPKEARRTDRVILLALAAATMAIKDAKLDTAALDLEKCGVIIGSGIGGIKFFEDEHSKLISKGPSRVSPFLIPMMIPDMAAGRVSMQFGFRGPNFAAVSACASSAHSIGESFLHIKAGMADLMVTGGTEAAVSPTGLAGFCSLRALSTRNSDPQKASRPFDKDRDGFVMAEGSAILILEELEHALARKAPIYAELLGYGASGDAHHLTAPAPEGAGTQVAIRMALRTAGLQASQIDYINAHGTSTDFNDKFETLAIKHVFGEEAARKVNISSTKSMTGHMLGAAGAIEAIASTLAIRDGIIPPTINYETPDPECDLNYTPNTAVKRNVKYVMSNSLGFGGHNAVLVIGKYDGSLAGK
ncbi:MAG: beta-ketoacyl-ACP synthase II [Chitinispirillaceae bacterium]|jgi:3-oxoacyl-[acyl-carrier-protein] synthase II|nr:beta-ketoacyl-ACP synthase II [Chitinispirillaceae bacterium]